MKRFVARYVSSGLVLIAAAMVSTASWTFWHRPEVPQELLKK